MSRNLFGAATAVGWWKYKMNIGSSFVQIQSFASTPCQYISMDSINGLSLIHDWLTIWWTWFGGLHVAKTKSFRMNVVSWNRLKSMKIVTHHFYSNSRRAHVWSTLFNTYGKSMLILDIQRLSERQNGHLQRSYTWKLFIKLKVYDECTENQRLMSSRFDVSPGKISPHLNIWSSNVKFIEWNSFHTEFRLDNESKLSTLAVFWGEHQPNSMEVQVSKRQIQEISADQIEFLFDSKWIEKYRWMAHQPCLSDFEFGKRNKNDRCSLVIHFELNQLAKGYPHRLLWILNTFVKG